MNENATTENAEKIGWEVLHWMIYLLIGTGVLAGAFWVLFYSTEFANISLFIPARNWYMRSYTNIFGQQPYPITVTSSNGTEYSYRLIGYFAGIDRSQAKITFFDYGHKEYSFSVNPTIRELSDAELSAQIEAWKQGALYIEWKDSRTLTKILDQYNSDPSATINTASIEINYYK